MIGVFRNALHDALEEVGADTTNVHVTRLSEALLSHLHTSGLRLQRQPGKNSTALGRRIRTGRQAAGLSQASFAEELGVTQSWVSSVETGRTLPNAERLESIARVLRIGLFDLTLDRPLSEVRSAARRA